MQQAEQPKAVEKTRTEEVHALYVEFQPAVDEVPDAARAAVAAILGPALRASDGGPSQAAERVAEVVRGIVTAAKKTGDSVWHASRGAVQGVVEATTGARADVFDAIRAATRTL